MNAKTGVVKCDSYDSAKLYTAIKTAAEAAGIPDVKGKKVLLKPNILSDVPPEKAVTTHPLFLDAVIRLVKEWGASHIYAGDSPGLHGPKFTPRACGIWDVLQKNGVEWVDFTHGKTELENPAAKVLRRVSVTRILEDVDFVINIPKLKNHQFMLFTGAIKNMFGIVPSLAKSPFHVRFQSREAFAAMLVDLNLSIKQPMYTFMDAVVGMEGPGPGSGTPKQVGVVLASPNTLAVDIAASSIIGYPAHLIPSNKEALSRKHWLKDIGEIEYPLLKPEDVKVSDYKKIPFKRQNNNFFGKLFRKKTPVPQIQKDMCKLCGDCVRICASGAIKITGDNKSKYVEINSKSCICCYCCHEVCPAKAILV